ncbi:hypothetical protein [Leclercia sp. CFBP8987]|uniref:hypothetical protein n=1 Tax=Leclercia sp. CFBP8987 TaxID=3096525 RepID=UPI002A6A0C48|nr:hypothetical protein [Leclercia sp. CFBP8987]MDY0922646.1 hypothetical protein [Leclercia sp. CFBP8987]
MEESCIEIKNMVEALPINALKKALHLKLSEARLAASNFQESSHLAPFLQSSKEKQFYDQLCFFIERTKNIKASIIDCNNTIKKTRAEISLLKRKQELEHHFFHSLQCDFANNLEIITNCLTDGNTFSNISNEVAYKIQQKIKQAEKITENEITDLLNSLDYLPISLKHFIPGIYIKEGEYEKFSLAKNKLITLNKTAKSKKTQSRLSEHANLFKKINEMERAPEKIAETIFLWRKELMYCFRINYKKEDISHTPSLLIKESY